jgi:hypothetical protein
MSALGRSICDEVMVFADNQITEMDNLCEVLGNPDVNEPIFRYRQKSRVRCSIASEWTFIAPHFAAFQYDNHQRPTVSELHTSVNRNELTHESIVTFANGRSPVRGRAS